MLTTWRPSLEKLLLKLGLTAFLRMGSHFGHWTNFVRWGGAVGGLVTVDDGVLIRVS